VIDASSVASSTPRVVFESAIHLYLPESNPENSTGKLLR
jgi:hypothetical protein